MVSVNDAYGKMQFLRHFQVPFMKNLSMFLVNSKSGSLYARKLHGSLKIVWI